VEVGSTVTSPDCSSRVTWAVDTNEQTDDAGGDVEGGEVKDGEVEEGEAVGAEVDGDREFDTSADGATEHPRRTMTVTKIVTRRTRRWSGRQRCVRFSGVRLLVDSVKSTRDPEWAWRLRRASL
jgi:hypothetical protein